MPTCPPREGYELRFELSAPTHHHGQPLVHGDPADLQRVGHIHEVVLAGADHFKQLLRPGDEPLFVLGRQDVVTGVGAPVAIGGRNSVDSSTTR